MSFQKKRQGLSKMGLSKMAKIVAKDIRAGVFTEMTFNINCVYEWLDSINKEIYFTESTEEEEMTQQEEENKKRFEEGIANYILDGLNELWGDDDVIFTRRSLFQMIDEFIEEEQEKGYFKVIDNDE
jgi:hypothetical protein